MPHYLIELLGFVAAAYVLGCLVGWIAKNILGEKPSA